MSTVPSVLLPMQGVPIVDGSDLLFGQYYFQLFNGWGNAINDIGSQAGVTSADFTTGPSGLVLQIEGPNYSTVSAELNTTADFQVVGGTPPTLTQIAVDLAKAYHFSTTNFTTASGLMAVNTIAVNALIVGQALFAGTATFAAVAPGANITTLTATITAAQTTATVASGAGITNGSFYLIDSELVQVTGGGGSPNLTIARGQLGSTAIPHISGAHVANYTYGGEVQIGGNGITLADNYHAPVNTFTLAATGFSVANSTSGASFQCTAQGCTVYGSGSTSGNYVTVSAGGLLAVAPPSNITTLNGGINAVQTSCTVFSGASVSNGGYYQIDGEVIQVTAGGGTTALTIARAQFGSTAAAHASGANFSVFTAMALESGELFMVGGGQNCTLTNTQFRMSGPGGTCTITAFVVELANGNSTLTLNAGSVILTAAASNAQIELDNLGNATFTGPGGNTSVIQGNAITTFEIALQEIAMNSPGSLSWPANMLVGTATAGAAILPANPVGFILCTETGTGTVIKIPYYAN